MSLIALAPVDKNSIDTPPSGYVSMFFDSSDNTLLKYKTPAGVYVTVGGSGSGNSNYLIVNTLSARDAIEPEDRIDGLIVYVKDTTGVSNAKKPLTYQLQGGISNGDWRCLSVIKEEHVVYTAGQTVFSLTGTQDPDKNIKVFIGGIYLSESHYTLNGQVFTWAVSGVSLEVGEVLTFFMQE